MLPGGRSCQLVRKQWAQINHLHGDENAPLAETSISPSPRARALVGGLSLTISQEARLAASLPGVRLTCSAGQSSGGGCLDPAASTTKARGLCSMGWGPGEPTEPAAGGLGPAQLCHRVARPWV